MSRRRYILTLFISLALLTAPCLSLAKGWEPVKSEKTHGNKKVVSESELEILASGGVIYIVTSKSVNIKIFTILGSRIADDTLAPGTYQFAVPTHGVYIIKAGDLTCKVAV